MSYEDFKDQIMAAPIGSVCHVEMTGVMSRNLYSNPCIESTNGKVWDLSLVGRNITAFEIVPPEAKFKVGDRVTWYPVTTVLTIERIETVDRQHRYFLRGYHSNWASETYLTLYVPPTPTKLIPTLVEHEWVRGTMFPSASVYKNTFGPGATYIWMSGMWVGHVFLKDVEGRVGNGIETIERCDDPNRAVK